MIFFGCAQLGDLGAGGWERERQRRKKKRNKMLYYFQLARLALINCHLPSVMLRTGAVWSFFFFFFPQNTNLVPKFLSVSAFLLFCVSTTLHCYSRKSVTDVFPFISWRWWWGGSGGLQGFKNTRAQTHTVEIQFNSVQLPVVRHSYLLQMCATLLNGNAVFSVDPIASHRARWSNGTITAMTVFGGRTLMTRSHFAQLW